LPDHPLLDRIVRGRTWIALLGVMLVGIVAMQVEMLKLGASVGRSSEQITTLQSSNEAKRASVAELSSDRRIESLAGKAGMVMPGPTDIGFVSYSAQLHRALANIRRPEPSTFGSTPTSNGAVTTSADQTSYSAAPSGSTYTP
jgi:hypothetical protein